MTKVSQAVILAAGMGTRLGNFSHCKPKGFLQLSAYTLIEESLHRLVQAGVEEIIIVTGFEAECYQKLAEQFDGLVHIVHNDKFNESGSLYSLSLATPLLQGDYLLLESDIIYESRALLLTLACDAQNVTLLSGPTGAGDEVYVSTSKLGEQLSLKNMSKDKRMLGDNIFGELVGIHRISWSLHQVLMDFAHQQFTVNLNLDYETDGLVSVAASLPINTLLVEDLLWGEIDDVRHLERMQSSIYEQICRQDDAERALWPEPLKLF